MIETKTDFDFQKSNPTKKNIMFFSRSELTYLYGSIHKYLESNFNIIHVAYSKHEVTILANEFGIHNVIDFKAVAETYLELIPGDEELIEIDSLLVKASDGRFNLNAMLQSNRSSVHIGYENAIQLANVYWKAWKKIFEGNNIHFLVHEPVSLMMNQIAEAVCKSQGGVYTTHILVHGDTGDHNFIMVDHYNGVPNEIIKNYQTITDDEVSSEDRRIVAFLEKFRSSYGVFFSALGSGANNASLKLKLWKNICRRKIADILKPKKFHPIMDNIELFLHNDNLSSRRIKNIREYKKVRYDEFDPSIPYYFFPLHLEPEAVVLYWADGMYTNQVKLIENIAAQLPPGVFLYVKDHPHLFGYRDKVDYDRIQSIPNVKLLKTSISGKQIIKDCKGVITINGTGGFEALLMNKHVVTLGSAFYSASDRVKYIKDIKSLRELIYDIQMVVYEDDKELKKFVLAYLKSQKTGFTDFYGGMHIALNINLDKNGELVAKGLTDFFTSRSV